jgi:hypothetical protein
MDRSAQRVSDAEREAAAAALKEDLLAGRLTTEEFSQRVERAYAARIGSDLEAVRRDLPAGSSGGLARRTRVSVALLSHMVRRGRQRLGRRVLAVSALGDLDLDLREAELSHSATTVTVVALLGNVDVYVPDQLAASLRGVGALGHQRDRGSDASRPGAPEVRVRVLSLLGTVDLWRVPGDVRSTDYGEVFRAVKERQRELGGGARKLERGGEE